jgi:uncharacterized protein (TIGR00369 family)
VTGPAGPRDVLTDGRPGPAQVRRRSHEWADPAVSAAAAATMAGADFLRALADGTLPPPPVVGTLGISLVSVDPGRVVFGFTPAEFHYNPIGTVHGGVIATMCDSACGCAVHSLLPAGAFYTSQDLTVKFLRPVTAGTGPLRCEGTVLHLGSRTALAQASLTDAAGRRYAHATSSCLIFRPPAADGERPAADGGRSAADGGRSAADGGRSAAEGGRSAGDGDAAAPDAGDGPGRGDVGGGIAVDQQ